MPLYLELNTQGLRLVLSTPLQTTNQSNYNEEDDIKAQKNQSNQRYNDCQVHLKTPTDLPNRVSSSARVQPNLGIPVTRGFKIASINLASLYKNRGGSRGRVQGVRTPPALR